MIHYPKEDLDIMAKLLEYDADINVITKLVSIESFQSFLWGSDLGFL